MYSPTLSQLMPLRAGRTNPDWLEARNRKLCACKQCNMPSVNTWHCAIWPFVLVYVCTIQSCLHCDVLLHQSLYCYYDILATFMSKSNNARTLSIFEFFPMLFVSSIKVIHRVLAGISIKCSYHMSWWIMHMIIIARSVNMKLSRICSNCDCDILESPDWWLHVTMTWTPRQNPRFVALATYAYPPSRLSVSTFMVDSVATVETSKISGLIDIWSVIENQGGWNVAYNDVSLAYSCDS